MGNGATARQYCTCLSFLLRGSDPLCVYSEAEWDATCLCRCFPRQHRIRAHMLVRMAVLPDGSYERVVLREDRSLWFTWS